TIDLTMKHCLHLIAIALLSLACVQAEPVAVLPSSFKQAQQPQIAAGPDGAVHLVFGTKAEVPHTGKGRRPPADGAIFYVMTRDLKTFTAPVQLAALSKVALGMRRGPHIAVTEKALIVTAQSHEDGDVHAWLSTDAGKTWKEQRRINGTAGSAREGLHALAGNGRSVVAAAWLDDRNGGAEVWSRVSLDGGLTWQPERLVYHSPEGFVCQCCAPAVAVNAEGGVVIMWRNALAGARDLYSSVSTDGGRTFAPAEKLGQGTWSLNMCPMDGGAITWSAGAEPEAVWRRDTTVYLSSSSTKAPETKLAAQSMQPLIVMTGKTRTVLWESQGNLMIQSGETEPSVFAEKSRAASVTALPDGRAAIAWESMGQNGATLLLAAFTTPSGR
ncbi:MAG: sialidase family protein, partial [Prosthecobacter sp.]|nr:sialidase family protein [Prosthecobacter sp.]